MKKLCIGIAAAFCALILVAQTQQDTTVTTYRDLTQAIRANDLTKLRKLLSTPGAVRSESSLHMQPLHYAAIYGSTEALQMLLDAGADLEARSQQGATPLIYAAWDPIRTKRLIDKGARINVAATDGTTPLIIAVSVFGNTESVRYLLSHGADIKAVNNFSDDALIRAAGMGDPEMTRLLLSSGADAGHADKAGFTALQMAQDFTDQTRVDWLLKAGADVNSANTFSGIVKNGPIALTHVTPLMLAAPFADTATVAVLLKAGARVNDVDVRKMTPLMLAIATDQAKPATVNQLIAAGADVNAKDQNGESVLDWAQKFRRPEIVAALEQAGALGGVPSPAPHPADNSAPVNATGALSRTIPLLARGGPEFFKQGGGCNGCHHQPMAARVYAASLTGGVPTDRALLQSFEDALLAERPAFLGGLPLMQALPGDIDRILQPLMALAELHAPSTDFTDIAVHYLANRQDASGTWMQTGARPPIEDSNITRTALAIRAFKVYGWRARQSEFDERIHRAGRWLKQAEPLTTYEEADRIMGLQAAGGEFAQGLGKDAEHLLRKQRPDGGWAQTPYLESDAYATGLTLHTLYAAGLLTPSELPYRNGVAFLLRTQFPDGSWYVRSRAAKFQPYFQSGFPFNHDQWISSTGTAWAAIALMHAANGTSSAQARLF